MLACSHTYGHLQPVTSRSDSKFILSGFHAVKHARTLPHTHACTLDGCVLRWQCWALRNFFGGGTLSGSVSTLHGHFSKLHKTNSHFHTCWLCTQVAVLGPSDFFGEDALLGGVHQFTAVAAGDCCVGWLRPADMQLLDKGGLTTLLRWAVGETENTHWLFKQSS